MGLCTPWNPPSSEILPVRWYHWGCFTCIHYSYGYEVQESTREWTATDSIGLGMSSNSSVMVLDFRPESIIRLYQQMPHRQAGVLSGEAIQYGDNVKRNTHKSPETGGSILGLDLFSALTSREACDCSFRHLMR